MIKPLYRLDGRSIQTFGYGIVAAADIALNDVVVITTAGLIQAKSASTGPVLGLAQEAATAGATGGPKSTNILVTPFDMLTVYEADPDSGTVAVADRGDPAELVLDTGDWQLAVNGVTANTAKFRVLDVDIERNKFIVVLDTSELDQFQFYQAAQGT